MELAASWYIAMLSTSLKEKPSAIQLFGQQLLAWRSHGQPVIMQRYCAHFGADLADGELVDDCIQCPFHHWRYGADGKCISVPGIERLSNKSTLRTYFSVERYGYVWVWYGSETPLFPLPEYGSFISSMLM